MLAASALAADQPGERQVHYQRDVAPLLARHCVECHGPDAEQREAGLRLDRREVATARLESGNTAVVAGQPSRSEVVRRVLAKDDQRMPPSGPGLTSEETQTLIAWIQQGAPWQRHWAFTPPRRPRLPEVDNDAWVSNSIDRFILAELESLDLAPLPQADRRTLIRRVYLDVLGVPPTRYQVLEFVNDSRRDAWVRLVDRLLASPLHGQRYGRHWLDVARYGDSNGGDENHAFPFAWRYRDYVIDALNDDLPFDRFVLEQIAGDLIGGEAEHDTRQTERVTATGFLALGTKILAEKDPVKMRADLVDEQIDTVGKSFLALTIACARCHDHKFDPIPTKDYYALAGIFQSTELGEKALQTPQWRERNLEIEQQIAALRAEKHRLQQIRSTAGDDVIDLQAERFDRGNVSAITDGYGAGIGIISDPGAQQNFAEYDIQIPVTGEYLVQLRYAAESARPGRMLVNGKVIRQQAISQVTGGWMPDHQEWFSEGSHALRKGMNVLRLESAPLMSHIDRIRLVRDHQKSEFARALKRLDEIDRVTARLEENRGQEFKVMAASEAAAIDVRVHLRGSHLVLGEEVPRGFPNVVSVAGDRADDPDGAFQISDSSSGRMQLARWITDADSGAGGHAARVIANRVWHWHFGRPLVGTPNNFGFRGQRPTHPQLLDHLAIELIQHDWSLKSVHRQILLSSTYRQKVSRGSNDFYHGVPRRRLEAEVIRDSLLFHAGDLDRAIVGQPLMVTSQNPSPSDLKKNEQTYSDTRRRSVYLPVVRSNVYRFLTLFDFPNAATSVGRRDETTVATQALLMMNDPWVMRQAESVARSLADELGTDSDRRRITTLYERLFSRPPTVSEIDSALQFLGEFSATVKASVEGGNSGELAAWTGLCHTLFASSEFIYVE